MLPSATVSVAARLKAAGVQVRLTDENLHPFKPRESGLVGCNLPGAPSIPVLKSFQERNEVYNLKWVLGGQVVDGLTSDQFSLCFGDSAFSSRSISQLLGIDAAAIPPAENVSLVSGFQLIPDTDMKTYLSREFPLHISQGCAYRCTHCSADRGQEERYRDIEHIRTDLTYLRAKADNLGVKSPLHVFMSNLDVFQNPAQLENFAGMVLETFPKRPAFKFRGLATFASFLKMADLHPDVLSQMIRAGFHNVGFGVDGYGNNVWRSTRKPIRSEASCLRAFDLCKTFGIQAEALMVTGHAGLDTQESLESAYRFLEFLAREKGARPTPYVSTPCIPGSEGWKDPKYTGVVNTVLEKPWTFQALEFAGRANPLKGHSTDTAEAVNACFEKMCALPGSTTQPLATIHAGMSLLERRLVRATNWGRFER